MCKVLVVNFFFKAVNIFEKMEISGSIYEGVVEPYHKNLLVQKPAVLITAVKIEDNPPHHILTPQWSRSLTSAENGM